MGTIFLPRFVVRVVDAHTPTELEELAECLVRLNQIELRRSPGLPHPYAAGLVYEQQPTGVNDWLTIPYALRPPMLNDDRVVPVSPAINCHTLAAYLCAWLREREGDSEARMVASIVGNTRLGGPEFHWRVRHGSGDVEDPSEILGLRRR